MALRALQRGVGASQRESSEGRMIKFCSRPRESRVALLASTREA